MDDLNRIPEWLGTAIIGAVIAALAYVVKLIIQWIIDLRTNARVRHARLAELFSLVKASQAAYNAQKRNREMLYAYIEKTHINNTIDSQEEYQMIFMDAEQDGYERFKEKSEGEKGEKRELFENTKEGYEQLFSRTFFTMDTYEKELHTIIRGITIHTIKPLNDKTLKWLQEDTYYKARIRGNSIGAKVAKKLLTLEAHLYLWQAKYNVWIPDNPEHSLVYLADEKKHGIGFPKDIEDDILELLKPKHVFPVLGFFRNKKKTGPVGSTGPVPQNGK